MGMLPVGAQRASVVQCEQEPPKDDCKNNSLLRRVAAAAMVCFNDPEPGDPSMEGIQPSWGGDAVDDDYDDYS